MSRSRLPRNADPRALGVTQSARGGRETLPDIPQGPLMVVARAAAATDSDEPIVVDFRDMTVTITVERKK